MSACCLSTFLTQVLLPPGNCQGMGSTQGVLSTSHRRRREVWRFTRERKRPFPPTAFSGTKNRNSHDCFFRRHFGFRTDSIRVFDSGPIPGFNHGNGYSGGGGGGEQALILKKIQTLVSSHRDQPTTTHSTVIDTKSKLIPLSSSLSVESCSMFLQDLILIMKHGRVLLLSKAFPPQTTAIDKIGGTFLSL